MKLWFVRGAWASRKGREKAARLNPERVESIAIIRHAAIGDMIITRPFIHEVRRHFPNASITLSLVSNYTYGAPTDLVDRVHVAIGSDNRQASLREQIAAGRALGYHDILFDAAGTTRSYWLCLLNKAGLKVGFPYHAWQRPLLYDVAVLRSEFRFEADVMMDMLHLFGFHTRHPLDFALTSSPLQRPRPYVVYFPSASIPGKCWPHERFADLVARMAERYPDHDHVVLEGVKEWESIDDILSAQGDLPNVEGAKTASLDELMSLLQGASLVVANDTGVRNAAIAAGTPTVGIFFSTIPYTYWPRDGRHDAVFRPDGELPSVDEVFESSAGMLKSVRKAA